MTSKIKRAAAAILALSMALSVAACGDSEGSEADSSSMPPKELEESQQEIVQRLADSITEPRELESNEIDWFSFYDINPTASADKEIGVDLALFQTKYNGKINYVQTTWASKFDDLASLLLSNEAPDFIGADDMDVFPRGALRDMIQPIDDYIDFEDPLWADMKTAMDEFMYEDSHYVGVVRVDPCYVTIYNRTIIEAEGLDDPADLYANGEWNWDTFADMCVEFTDAENDKYALDGWYYDTALTASSGLPLISMENGVITNNISSPELAKAQNMLYDLQLNGVCYPKNEHNWEMRDNTVGAGIGTGLTLFYIVGLWSIEDAPSATEVFGDISAGDVMFVPVPCAADSEAQYAPARVHGFCIVEGASNPEGVAAFLDCARYAEIDESVKNIGIEQLQNDYGWTDEMIEMRNEVYDLIEANPVFEFNAGVSPDISNTTDTILKSCMNPADATTWSEVVASYEQSLDYMINQAQESLSGE